MQFHIAAAVRAVLLVDPPMSVAGMAEVGPGMPMAEEAFGGRLLAGIIGMLAFDAGIVLGWTLHGLLHAAGDDLARW